MQLQLDIRDRFVLEAGTPIAAELCDVAVLVLASLGHTPVGHDKLLLPSGYVHCYLRSGSAPFKRIVDRLMIIGLLNTSVSPHL